MSRSAWEIVVTLNPAVGTCRAGVQIEAETEMEQKSKSSGRNTERLLLR